MKKILFRLIVVLVLLIIIGLVVLAFSLDRVVKAAIESVGPKLTGVDVKVEKVSLSLWSGKGSIKGFEVGNPAGFKAPWAMRVEQASVELDPRSLISDKIVIKSIDLEAPEIVLEFGSDPRANNLGKILSNVEGAKSTGETGQSNPPAAAQPAQQAPPQEAKGSKKLEVDDFVITSAKIHVSSAMLGGEVMAQKIPDIHLQDLGKGPEGITPAQLTEKVLAAIQAAAAQAAAGSLTDISKGALYVPKNLPQSGSNAVEKATKGLGNLLNR